MIVDELKKSILDSAFKGNLTKQLDSDSDVDVYLNVVKSYDKIKRKDLEEKAIELYLLPSNWKWVKLGDVVGIYGGKRIPAGRKLSNVDTGHKYIRVADMNNCTINLDSIKYVPEDIYQQIMNYTINKEDLYITVAGTIGKIGFIPDELDGSNLTENADKIVFKNINKMWLFYLLNSPVVQNQIDSMITKVGQPKLAIKRIININIPLPSLEEQQRIVDKIDELFAKLDEIKPIEEKLNELKKNFPGEMRKSIMQSFLCGSLSTQSNNETVNEIINEIERYNKVTEVKEEDCLFDIPDNWRWIRFGELVDFNIGKTPPRNDSNFWSDGQFNWVSISDMIPNGYVSSTKEKVNQNAFNQIFKGNISKKGTLIMSFKMTLGRCSILNIDSFHHEGIISIYPKYKSEILKQYLFRFLPFLSNFGNYKNAIKGKTLNSKSLYNLLIPLPPLEEQQRIVDKLEILSPLCDEVENIISHYS